MPPLPGPMLLSVLIGRALRVPLEHFGKRADA